MRTIRASIQQLSDEPFASVVCYPRAISVEMQVRINELEELGVEAVEFSGKTSAHALQVLGKGYVGIVVVAQIGGERLALKMLRIDSGRPSLEREAELLRRANAVGVGPKFVAVTGHFLLMELVDGGSLEEWLTLHRSSTEVRRLVAEVLEQCWRLDAIGLDHGEISKAPKHILVSKQDKPFIVDFETASTTRNASNVTSVCQFLFQGNSEVCRSIAQVLGPRNREELVAALRRYRKERTRENFESLLRLCVE